MKVTIPQGLRDGIMSALAEYYGTDDPAMIVSIALSEAFRASKREGVACNPTVLNPGPVVPQAPPSISNLPPVDALDDELAGLLD
jgi:hypothetical protein